MDNQDSQQPQPPLTPQPSSDPYQSPAQPMAPQSQPMMPPASTPQSFQRPAMTSPAPMSSQPAGKNLLWLWITLGVALLLIIGVVVTFFVAKSNADKVATTYTSEVKTYLGEVSDAAKESVSNPADVVANIKEVKKPVLQSAFMSGVSGKYSEAVKLSKDVDAKVGTTSKEIESLVSLYAFYEDWKKIDQEIAVLANSANSANVRTVFGQIGDKLDATVKLVEDAKLPADMKDEQDALLKANTTCRNAWKKMTTALNSGDRATYNTGLTEYSNCLTPLRQALTPFKDQHDNVSSKIKESAKPVDDLEDQLSTEK
jgi:hypothetical protein